MAKTVAAILLGLLASAAFWYWQGREHELPPFAVGDGRLHCASYTPFRGEESPFDDKTDFDPALIDQDLALLKQRVDCVRIYSMKGLEHVPVAARANGLKLIAGAWLGRDAAANEYEIAALIRMANAFPDVVSTVVVGNEVLLRRELVAEQLIAYIRRVKAAVSQTVTYADVWEFWLQNPQMAPAVDQLTIHLLPYWENDPSGIDSAIAAVERAHAEITRAFPGKPIFIGETGWPSEGRQREDAGPSRVNQALFLRGFAAAAARHGWGYNIIEAFDQPWKRRSEGVVGGYWGLFDTARVDKQVLATRVSNLPQWRDALGMSIVVALLLLVRGGGRVPLAVAAAFVAGNCAVGEMQLAQIAVRDALEAVWHGVLMALPLLLGWACVRHAESRAWPDWAGRVLLPALMLACVQMLGLAFDSRYRDFPVAAFAVPALALVRWRACGARPTDAMRLLGWVLAACMPAVLWQETPWNTQAMLWLLETGAMAAALLLQPRGANSPLR